MLAALPLEDITLLAELVQQPGPAAPRLADVRSNARFDARLQQLQREVERRLGGAETLGIPDQENHQERDRGSKMSGSSPRRRQSRISMAPRIREETVGTFVKKP